MKLLVNIPFYDRVRFVDGWDGWDGLDELDGTAKEDKKTTFMNGKIYKYSWNRRSYVYNKLWDFLLEVNEYPMFSSIHIRIDTNNDKNKLFTFDELTLKKHVHMKVIYHSISNPFLLTWVHRKYITSNIDNYDWIMYLEDDIFIPRSSVIEYMKWSELLYRNMKKILHFVRVVQDSKQKIYFGDLRRKSNKNVLFQLNQSYFGSMTYSYSAAWLYPRIIMKDFMKHHTWSTPYNKNDIRASAAFGFLKHPLCTKNCLVTKYPCNNINVFHVLASGNWYHNSHTTRLPFNNGTGWIQ